MGLHCRDVALIAMGVLLSQPSAGLGTFSFLVDFLEHEVSGSLSTMLLVFARVGPVCALAPWLFLRGAPAGLRAAVAFVLALAFVPLATLPPEHAPLGLGLIIEAARGGLFALATTLPWIAFDVLFRTADHGRGQSGNEQGVLGLERTSQLGNAGGLLLGALFVAAGGLRHALEVLATSFVDVPLGVALAHGGFRAMMLTVTREIVDALLVGVRITTPLLLIAGFVELSLGLASRVGGSLSLHFAAMPMRVLATFAALLVALTLAWPHALELFAHALRTARVWLSASG